MGLAGVAGRVPFDLPEGESEVIAGFTTELGSVGFSAIMLSEYSIGLLVGMLLLTMVGLPAKCIVVALAFLVMARVLLLNCYISSLPS